MRDVNFKIPDIEKEEALKEKLRRKLSKIIIDGDEDQWNKLLNICDWYADKKIDQIFKEEDEKRRFERPCKNCGKINRTRSSVCEKCCPSKL